MIADGTGTDFTFSPGNAGSYTITFTVSDQNGGSDSSIAMVTARAVTPVLTAPAAAQSAVPGQSAVFDLGTLAVKGVGPWTVTVAWGDGQTVDAFHRRARAHCRLRTRIRVKARSYFRDGQRGSWRLGLDQFRDARCRLREQSPRLLLVLRR